MIKLFAMEATSNIAVAINGRKREDFGEGDKVLVTRDEYLSLLRLGFKFVGEAEVTYKDIAKLVVSPEDVAKALAEKLEAEMPKVKKEDKPAKKAAKKDETPAEVPAETPESVETTVETSVDAE
jgi:hypothetical protein